MKQNLTNHIALVIDRSYSMSPLTDAVVKVADDLIKYLANRSKTLNQETRITVYLFNDSAQCAIFDMDVLRLPSIGEFYRASGNTALIDATMLSISDLRMTPQKYGDHAFLTYVLTDGEENASSTYHQWSLKNTMSTLKDNETVAVLVPDHSALVYAEYCGFPKNNIAIWETTIEGLKNVSDVITRSADAFMENRVLGIRSSANIFTTSTEAVNTKTVNSKRMVSLERDKYVLLDVDQDKVEIREWVRQQDYDYVIGKAYYQLTKTEIIQPQKNVAIQNIHSGRVYTGPQARQALNLPDVNIRVKPEHNPKYRIFVQSTSTNRKLVKGTKLLYMV